MLYRFLLSLTLTLTISAVAQVRSPTVTADDYARAESFLRDYTEPLVYGATDRHTWLPDDRLWYRNTIPQGSEFILVDPATGRRARAFDHARLARALSAATDTTYEVFDLPFRQFEFSQDGGSITFEVKRRTYTCDLSGYRCKADEGDNGVKKRNMVVSPAGRLAAFSRDYNLWTRDLETGKETQLTTDGQKDFGYATNNAGWIKSDRPVLSWSPDSKKIATFQHDARGVGEMYLVSTAVGHPELQAWKYPLPGDSLIFRMHRVVIHLNGPRIVRLQMPPDPHRSTISDHVADRAGNWLDVEWSEDASQLAFVSSSRDHKEAKLRVADLETGRVRDVLEETVDTFFESGYRKVNWHVLKSSGEAIWFSQRDDWGHLYLYDLETGRLKNRITSGTWNVLQLRRIEKKTALCTSQAPAASPAILISSIFIGCRWTDRISSCLRRNGPTIPLPSPPPGSILWTATQRRSSRRLRSCATAMADRFRFSKKRTSHNCWPRDGKRRFLSA